MKYYWMILFPFYFRHWKRFLLILTIFELIITIYIWTYRCNPYCFYFFNVDKFIAIFWTDPKSFDFSFVIFDNFFSWCFHDVASLFWFILFQASFAILVLLYFSLNIYALCWMKFARYFEKSLKKLLTVQIKREIRVQQFFLYCMFLVLFYE